jgi:hypothetical protein
LWGDRDDVGLVVLPLRRRNSGGLASRASSEENQQHEEKDWLLFHRIIFLVIKGFLTIIMIVMDKMANFH